MKRSEKSASILSMKPEGDFKFEHKDSTSVCMWAWLASAIFLGAVFVICAVFYVWLYVQQVQNGYRLSKIYEESEFLSMVQRKLTIEWSRFRDPQRLGEIGQNQFGLARPRPDQTVVMR
ncbi:MAG: cell division protein FtsL [Syntrophobacteraceae bacterium]|jgi:cell division protein FtsL